MLRSAWFECLNVPDMIFWLEFIQNSYVALPSHTQIYHKYKRLRRHSYWDCLGQDWGLTTLDEIWWRQRMLLQHFDEFVHQVSICHILILSVSYLIHGTSSYVLSLGNCACAICSFAWFGLWTHFCQPPLPWSDAKTSICLSRRKFAKQSCPHWKAASMSR